MRLLLLIALLIFRSVDAEAKQWIVFHAEEGIIGHAFATFVQEDEVGKLVTVGTFGMNTSGFEEKDYDIGYTFYLEANDAEWELCYQTLLEWSKKKVYVPLAQDCVSFMKDLVGNFSRVTKPGLLYVVPADYVNRLKSLNPLINSNSKTSLFKSALPNSNGSRLPALDTVIKPKPVAASKHKIATKTTLTSAGSLLGGKTPDELGKLLLKALVTNNQTLWNKCLLPAAGMFYEKNDASREERVAWLKKSFTEAREGLEENGVSDFSLIKFSRVIFYKETPGWSEHDNGVSNGEQVRRMFRIEFSYGSDYVGVIDDMTIITFNKGNYFLYSVPDRPVIQHR